MKIDCGSFRDPAGQVFTRDGQIFRSIFAPGVADYQAARDSGVLRQLIESGALLPSEEVPVDDRMPSGTALCLHHPRLPMISYPWEWSFSMLKEAALLQLEIMEQLLPHRLWLRDASAFNIQHDGRKLRLIDTLSVGRTQPESPWVAYGQFCSHFLAPLALAAYCDIRTLALWRQYINGYPLDLAARLLPKGKRYRPRLFWHLTLHSRFQESADRMENKGKQSAGTRTWNVSPNGLLGIVRSLRHTIADIHWKRFSRVWEDYGKIRTYNDEAVSRKSEYVASTVRRTGAKTVWDLGANTGEFSLIAAAQGAFVVSIDGDPACTENLYLHTSRSGSAKNILPLTMDLTNPSPGTGWAGEERMSLDSRGPADLILALALIHHLVLTGSIPLPKVAEWFHRLASYALVEFVPPDDPMVRRLLSRRGEDHLPYNESAFRSAFTPYFSTEDRCPLPNGRTLFLFRKRPPNH